MPELDEVINGLKACLEYPDECTGDCTTDLCPYCGGDCHIGLLKDILALLEAQQPKVLTLEEVLDSEDESNLQTNRDGRSNGTDEFISKTAALDAIDGIKPIRENFGQLLVKSLCYAVVKTMQPVDAAPVVHGQWLYKRYDFKECKSVIMPYDATTFDNHVGLFCSLCNVYALLNGVEDDVPSNYCPHCGAKMDGTDIAVKEGD